MEILLYRSRRGKRTFFAFWRGFSKKKEGDKISKIEGGEGQKKRGDQKIF